LYPHQWYNGQAYTAEETGYMLRYLRLLGGAQLRQVRVTDRSCYERRFTNIVNSEGLGKYDTKDGTCYSEFDEKAEQKYSYGPRVYSPKGSSPMDMYPFGTTTLPAGARQWDNASEVFDRSRRYFYSSELSDLEGLYGFGPDYLTGGYVINLPLNRTRAYEIVDQLEKDLWLDKGTRVVSLDLNVFNMNTRLLTVVSEWKEGGCVVGFGPINGSG
jgi:hypothetical protein